MDWVNLAMRGNLGNEVVKKRILSQIVKQIQTGCPSLTRVLGSRVGPDFAGLDRRKTGSWEVGSQLRYSLMTSQGFVEVFQSKRNLTGCPSFGWGTM